MYLVRHVRGTESELGLKQPFRLLSNTLGMKHTNKHTNIQTNKQT